MKFRVTYEHGDRHCKTTDTKIVEANNEREAESKISYEPGDEFCFVRKVEPMRSVESMNNKYRVTYEHGDRHSRTTDTIIVEANSLTEATRKIPHEAGDEFCFVVDVQSLENKKDQQKDGFDR